MYVFDLTSAEIHMFFFFFLKHAVQLKGKLRYGLTGRYIKPENIARREHWKGEFHIPEDEVYDGDLKLFRERYPEEA